MRFSGRAAVVTGGGHGIGRATAERLASEGATVAVCDLREERAAETVNAIESNGGVAHAYAVDVADPDAVESVMPTVRKEIGPVDVLHNNAGILIPGSVLDHALEDWDRQFAVNVRSMVLCARAVLPDMIERRSGAIINMGSVSGLVGDEALAGYDASKAAVINLTRQLAADYARYGIRPNCVCPGWVKTGFNDPSFEADPTLDEDEIVTSSVPVARQAKPEEIAAAICFLASDDASYIVGHALVVDGGVMAVP